MMSKLDSIALGDSLNRMAKIALDSGEAASIEDALALFRTYALHIHVTPQLAGSVSQQAALLTAVNAARRAFLGGVSVSGIDGIVCTVPGFAGSDIAVAVLALGARCVPRPDGAPIIQIGGGPPRYDAHVRTVTRGWCGGCVPRDIEAPDDDPDAFVLAGVVAGAIAVCEIFQMVRRSNPIAGQRSVGLSLWDPKVDWTDAKAMGAPPLLLPAAAWIIGLGNLGQAFLWSIGMLPYQSAESLTLTLQDFDTIAPSNDSTSLLTRLDHVGQPKTRRAAAWAEERGFKSRLVERRFGSHIRVDDEDPAVALCGVDNALARSALEDAGFGCVLEAGLGGGVSDFLAIRLHSFPQQRKARDIWGNVGAIAAGTPDVLDRPAYQNLAAEGAERCGLVQLAGRTVGAPFVGAIAGALTIAELVRLANGLPVTAVADLHLRNLDHRFVVAQPYGFGCNPGLTKAL